MAEKYLLFDLDSKESKKLGEVISNPSCKKIINLLADKEMGISEIAKELGAPLNSVQYSVNNLKEAGLIEESKSFWSVKGKKMPSYKLVNKAIVISPKKGNIYSKIKGVLPVIATGVIFTGLFLWESAGEKIFGGEVFSASKNTAPELLKNVADNSAAGASTGASTVGLAQNVSTGIQTASSGLPITYWLLLVAWALLLLFVIWSFAKKKD